MLKFSLNSTTPLSSLVSIFRTIFWSLYKADYLSISFRCPPRPTRFVLFFYLEHIPLSPYLLFCFCELGGTATSNLERMVLCMVISCIDCVLSDFGWLGGAVTGVGLGSWGTLLRPPWWEDQSWGGFKLPSFGALCAEDFLEGHLKPKWAWAIVVLRLSALRVP